MKHLAALLSGVVFGVGLVLSGMTDTHKVVGFLDIAGNWDQDLLWVMASALAVSFFLTPLILKRGRPMLAGGFSLPRVRGIDHRLVLGALLFGCGWGLYGYCPGPALVALPNGDIGTAVFLLSMVLGMWLIKLTPQPTSRPSNTP